MNKDNKAPNKNHAQALLVINELTAAFAGGCEIAISAVFCRAIEEEPEAALSAAYFCSAGREINFINKAKMPEPINAGITPFIIDFGEIIIFLFESLYL